MKKIILLVLSLVLVLTFTSCGNKENEASSSDSSNVDTSVSEDVKVDSDLPNVFQVSVKDIYFNYPDMKVVDDGLSETFRLSNEFFIILIYDLDIEVEDLSSIPNDLEKKFFRYSGSYNKFYADEKSMNITGDTTKINGIDVYAFEGSEHLKTDDGSGDATCPIKGYAFYLDDCACELVGVVSNYENPDDYYGEMEEILDSMISTLRTSE